jgi:uncharacterized membrane protein
MPYLFRSFVRTRQTNGYRALKLFNDDESNKASHNSPNWQMLTSHHPRSQHDRTFKCGPIRCCVRCSGVLLGGFINLVACEAFKFDWIGNFVLVGIFIFLLLAGIEGFVLNETRSRTSRNSERLAFGILSGFLMTLIARSEIIAFVLVIVIIFIGQFYSALRLKKAGVLEAFFDEYFTDLWAPNLAMSNSQTCGKMMCRCKSVRAENKKL